LLVLQWRCLACACSHTCHNVTCVSAPAKRTCWRMLLADCLHGRAAHAACLPLRPPFRNTSGPLAPSPLRLSALTYTRSLANYTAETGFAPATHDVFIEAPMSAVDRANLDLVLPQIAAMQTFVSALARLKRCRVIIRVMLGFRGVTHRLWAAASWDQARAAVRVPPGASPGPGFAAPLPGRSASSAVFDAHGMRAALCGKGANQLNLHDGTRLRSGGPAAHPLRAPPLGALGGPVALTEHGAAGDGHGHADPGAAGLHPGGGGRHRRLLPAPCGGAPAWAARRIGTAPARPVPSAVSRGGRTRPGGACPDTRAANRCMPD